MKTKKQLRQEFYENKSGKPDLWYWIKKITPILILIFVLMLMIPSFFERFETKNYGVCYENACIRTTLDQFNECKDIGVENVGFLSSEHFYLCDGQKVTRTCLEWGEVKTTKEHLGFGMRCEEGEGK